MSAGERARDAFHIQTVNNRHSRLKGFLRGFRGIATKYLDSYLRWFHLVGLAAHASPRACLTAALNTAFIRFANRANNIPIRSRQPNKTTPEIPKRITILDNRQAG